MRGFLAGFAAAALVLGTPGGAPEPAGPSRSGASASGPSQSGAAAGGAAPESSGAARIERGRLVDRSFGYSMDLPEFAVAADAAGQAAFVFAAPVEGYAANVNVQTQAYAEGLAAFVELSVGQIARAGQVLESKTLRKAGDREACEFVFLGESQGRAVKWRALAVADGARILLVTCTATAASFDDLDPEFRAALESFRVLE